MFKSLRLDRKEPAPSKRGDASDVLFTLRFRPVLSLFEKHIRMRYENRDIDPFALREFAQRLDQLADRVERDKAQGKP